MKSIIILGSTGSIGTQTMEVISQYPQEFCVIGLSCDTNIVKLEEQIKLFHPQFVAVKNQNEAKELSLKVNCKVFCGEDGINALASIKCDIVVNSLVGISGLAPTIKAIEVGNDIALANKETLVAGGEVVMPLAKKYGVKIIPVDSEHSAIWQCINFKKADKIKKILLTASGGAFRDMTKQELENAKSCEALKHPTWIMGAKVTIDSATLMNKGLEIIEAMYLFDKNVDDIEIVIHKQSVVHSMVEYADGSVIAQLSYPDMKLPIQLALFYPKRGDFSFSPLNFEGLDLSFSKPDYEKFPCLSIAKYCARKKGVYPIIMNAANEILVKLYLNNVIKFYDIPYFINMALEKLGNDEKITSLEQIYKYNRLGRDFIMQYFEV